MNNHMQALIIDPSVVVRQTLVCIIRKMPGVEVSASWAPGETDGLIERIERKKPEVVILGLDSPEQAEGELFLKIRDRFPALPVIVLTPLSEQGARTALFALKNGAVEFVTKPARPDSLTLAERHLEKRLHQTLKRVPRFNREWLAAMKPTEMDPGREPALKSAGKADENEKRKQMMRSALTGTEKTADLVVIGGCTGGIPALFSLIDRLSPEIRVPVVVVQHMPRIYTRVLSEELGKRTSLRVREAAFDGNLVAGEIYIAPGGYHVRLRNNGVRKKISPHRGLKEHRSRPSIDVLLRSARHVYDNRVLSIFLSGGGRDGILGAREISACGGEVLLQDRESSLLWDLPGEIFERGASSEVLPADQLAEAIEKRVEVRFDQIQLDRERIRETVSLTNIQGPVDRARFLRI